MAKRSTHELAFNALTIEGGLLAPDFLNRIAHLEASDQKDTDYDAPRGLKLRDEIGRYWKIAQNLWQDFDSTRNRRDVDAHAVTVREFLEPLFRHVLGFPDVRLVGQVVLGERVFPIGFMSVGERVPLVFAGFDQPLDKPSVRHGDDKRRRSPFLLAQEYLNASDVGLWAIVSNGLKLRILRDNASLTRPAYIEADLEAIFTEGLYPDFAALWLLAHGTRFGKQGADYADCPLERWRNTAQEDGVRARDRLRIGVTEALRALGTGFLINPANRDLLRRLDSGQLTTQSLFEQLLCLIYRLIFLATIEDRDLLFAPEAANEARERFKAGYSLTRLRQFAARRRSYDRHGDLWQALGITFTSLATGQVALGLPALGGLFDVSQCADLDYAELDNHSLLSAIFSLCFFRDGPALSRVNYRDMDSEELGSVYESLLELVPTISIIDHRFGFVGDEAEGDTRGNARKLTGSYYTPDSLVQELIKSALDPVIAETLATHVQEPVDALLRLTVCDPACGSGHFLLAAARRIAEEIARLRATDGNPLPSDYRHALRDVIAHCIYGVDKNPMAIELAKTALWLEAYTPDRPLTFIDHHIRCGDALLGVLDPIVLENGIPEEAFEVLSGDDKAVAKRLKAENRAALKSLHQIKSEDLFGAASSSNAFSSLEALPDDTLAAVEAKRAEWLAQRAVDNDSLATQLADTYVAAFLMPKTEDHEATIPLTGYFWALSQGEADEDGRTSAAANYCRRHQVFHWWLEFPHIHSAGGFSVLLGNPPWERIKLQEEEFFASRSPLVADAQHKSDRGKRIELLKQGMLLHELFPDVEAAQGLMPPNLAEQSLYAEFLAARRGAEAASLFAHSSGRYPLTGIGDVNTYALFAESFAQLVASKGRAGFIVPTGIATDDSTKAYFGAISQSGRLVSLYDIENRDAVFPSVHRSYKFCLLTLGTVSAAEFVCFATDVGQLADSCRKFVLTPSEFRLINPNSLTCPIFRSQRDAELTKKLYRAAPVLIEGGANEKNPWGIRFMAMIHMSSDSGLFRNEWAQDYLPLYEAKMIHQFDHRWATYEHNSNDEFHSRNVTDIELADHEFSPKPRYWIAEREVLARIADVPTKLANAWLTGDHESLVNELALWLAGHLLNTVGLSEVQTRLAKIQPILAGAARDSKKWKRAAEVAAEYCMDSTMLKALTAAKGVEALVALVDEWMEFRSPRYLIGWRDICRSTDERTVIASVVPRAAIGHTLPVMLPTTGTAQQQAALLANLNCIVLDFVARQKVGGTHLTYGFLKQFPILAPDFYGDAGLEFIVSRVLELTYTTDNLAPWAKDLGMEGSTFQWDPLRRAVLRAELDAWYARAYGLGRDELRYILEPSDVEGPDYPSETFRVLKNSEIRTFGEYRTRRLVLEAWDRLDVIAPISHRSLV